MNTTTNEIESRRAWYESVRSEPVVAVVVNNNVPNGMLGCGEWLNIVQTEPNVTLPVGTKLYINDYHDAYESARDDMLLWRREARRLQENLPDMRDEVLEECAKICEQHPSPMFDVASYLRKMKRAVK